VALQRFARDNATININVCNNALNDLIAHALASAGTPVTKEPQGLLPMIPWQVGKALSWDVTVACPLAKSYVEAAAWDADAVAEIAATRKLVKYVGLDSRYIFQPIAVESLGPINDSATTFLGDLG